ncbi:DUF2165 family protein [Enterobacter ludwigii]|uniref:DUF2165 family protein n=1 Tax=Enterobacter TaxID=547 RepID=UPI003BEEF9E4
MFNRCAVFSRWTGSVAWGMQNHIQHNYHWQKLFIIVCVPAVLVWYTGFAVTGGEYLAMWANQWNDQANIYTFVILFS